MKTLTKYSPSQLQELMGARARLLEKTQTRRLASADERIVIFGGQPVGIIQRRPGAMLWFSTARTWPFGSIADAALSIVGEVFQAKAEGGMPAVYVLIAAARAAAGQLAEKLKDEDYPESVAGGVA